MISLKNVWNNLRLSLPSTSPPPRNRAPSFLQEQPSRAIEREDTQKPQSDDKSGRLSQQQQGAAAAETLGHYSVDATVTCQRPAQDATTRLRQWLSSTGACETSPSTLLRSPGNDDDSGAPDVVAHIIIRTVPDSVKNS